FENDAPGFAGGDGTALDPYQVEDWYQLQLVREYLTSHFILNNDLDENTLGYVESASSTANGNAGWIPIMGDCTIQMVPTCMFYDEFSGVFDGKVYSIKSLYINRPPQEYVGLFGAINSGGQVTNLRLIDFTIIGKRYVGSLTGKGTGGTFTE